MGRPHRMAVWIEPIFKYLFSLLSTLSALYTGEGSPGRLQSPFGSEQEKWNDQYLPLSQASTQKPCCSSYMWQVLVLPKLQSFFGYLFLFKYKQVSCLKVPSQRPLNNRDRIKPHGNSTARWRPSKCICSVAWQTWSEGQRKALAAHQVLRMVSSLVPSWGGCHYWCSCSVWRGKAADGHSQVSPE